MSGDPATLAVSFSNGILSSIPKEHFSWEVTDQRNHILLPKACVGYGTFDKYNCTTHLNHQYTIACCSRDGSVIMIPKELFTSSYSWSPSDVIRYQIPCDSDGEDGSIRYVQGFTAGYIRTKVRKGEGILTANGGKVQPLLFRALSGGLIDVYVCNRAKDSYSDRSCSGSNIRSSEEDLKLQFISLAVETLLRIESYDNVDTKQVDMMLAASNECKLLGNNVEEVIARISKNGIENYPKLKRFIEISLIGAENF